MRNDVAAKKEIDKLCIVCVNEMTGCEWKGLFKDYAVSLICLVMQAVQCVI